MIMERYKTYTDFSFSWQHNEQAPVVYQVVINNAGVYGNRVSLDTVTAEDMMFTYRANTIGPLLVVQQLLKNKLIGKPGTLVGNVTSKVGLVYTCRSCIT